MKLNSRLLDVLVHKLLKRPFHVAKPPEVSDDPQVTKAIADKIVDDARKHRLAIEGEEREEDD
jgi:hypothetical protein